MSTSIKTRSGRVSKKPVSYEPNEIPEDDFAEEEHDGSYVASDTDMSESDEEDFSDDDDEEADKNGNLKDFIVDDASESDEEDDA
jgi:hypothetical protein